MPDIIDEELNGLIEEISEDIHADCYLTATLKKKGWRIMLPTFHRE